MKILCLTSRLPFPPYGGDRLRAYYFIRYLIQKRHKVILASFIESKSKLEGIESFTKNLYKFFPIYLSKISSYINCLKGLVGGEPLQVSYYRSKKMKGLIRQVLKNEDVGLIYVHLIRMADFVKSFNKCPKVLDLTDSIGMVHARILGQKGLGLEKLISLFEKKRASVYEKSALCYFTKNLVTSRVDKNFILKRFSNGDIDVVPNGVDLDQFQYSDSIYDPKKIIMVGNFHSLPNRDGLKFFLREIFPLVLKGEPEARFYIVGINIPRSIKKFDDKKNIFVVGRVEDLTKWYHSSCVSIAPLKVAGGIQNKILEPMACGIPVVATTIAQQGINAVDGCHILIVDTPQEFARKILNLMQKKDLRNKIALNARSLIEKEHQWQRNIDKALDKLVL